MSILNFGLLTLSLNFQLGAFRWAQIVGSISKSLICSGLMGWILWQMDHISRELIGDNRLLLAGKLVLMIITGVCVFMLSAKMIGQPEVRVVFGLLKRSRDIN